jgi:quercetin dioxygenase-like cupin family protein
MTDPIDYQITHHFGPAVYAKQMHLAAGQAVATHKHRFDHLSILARGRAVVEVDGVATSYSGPAGITIAAGREHTITAITAIDWFCIHATSETDVDAIDATLIEEN